MNQHTADPLVQFFSTARLEAILNHGATVIVVQAADCVQVVTEHGKVNLSSTLGDTPAN